MYLIIYLETVNLSVFISYLLRKIYVVNWILDHYKGIWLIIRYNQYLNMAIKGVCIINDNCSMSVKKIALNEIIDHKFIMM